VRRSLLTEPDPIDEVGLSDDEWREQFDATAGSLESRVNEVTAASIARLHTAAISV
jgi:hypothetical protein